MKMISKALTAATVAMVVSTGVTALTTTAVVIGTSAGLTALTATTAEAHYTGYICPKRPGWRYIRMYHSRGRHMCRYRRR